MNLNDRAQQPEGGYTLGLFLIKSPTKSLS